MVKFVLEGWGDVFFGWKLDLDWFNLMVVVNDKIVLDGWELFGIFFMMVLLKGIF